MHWVSIQEGKYLLFLQYCLDLGWEEDEVKGVGSESYLIKMNMIINSCKYPLDMILLRHV